MRPEPSNVNRCWPNKAIHSANLAYQLDISYPSLERVVLYYIVWHTAFSLHLLSWFTKFRWYLQICKGIMSKLPMNCVLALKACFTCLQLHLLRHLLFPYLFLRFMVVHQLPYMQISLVLALETETRAEPLPFLLLFACKSLLSTDFSLQNIIF